jgi:hypothetical protein
MTNINASLAAYSNLQLSSKSTNGLPELRSAKSDDARISKNAPAKSSTTWPSGLFVGRTFVPGASPKIGNVSLPFGTTLAVYFPASGTTFAAVGPKKAFPGIGGGIQQVVTISPDKSKVFQWGVGATFSVPGGVGFTNVRVSSPGFLTGYTQSLKDQQFHAVGSANIGYLQKKLCPDGSVDPNPAGVVGGAAIPFEAGFQGGKLMANFNGFRIPVVAAESIISKITAVKLASDSFGCKVNELGKDVVDLHQRVQAVVLEAGKQGLAYAGAAAVIAAEMLSSWKNPGHSY